MAEEFARVVDSSSVGWGEAENPHALKGASTVPKTKEEKANRLVEFRGFSLKAVLPEQGSWHLERKRAILKKHPEIQKLYGPNPWTAVLLVFCFSAHLWVGYMTIGASLPVHMVIAYTIGALLSWQCAAIGHEGAHKTVFKNSAANKVLALIAFLPVVMGPFGNFWSVEHMWHHQVIVDKMQRYGPQNTRPLRKAIAALLFFPIVNVGFTVISLLVFVRSLVSLALYALGMKKEPFPTSFNVPPYRLFPQIVNRWFMMNMILSIIFNAAIYFYWGADPLLYFFLSCGFSNGLHPLGMRQVQEHYLQKKGQPTYSVYSPFNWILLNLGCHVEHHDFPQIPWNRLPKVREIAPEFYGKEALFSYESYTQVLGIFLFNDGVPLSSLVEDFQDVLPIAAEATTGAKKLD